jgi:hypothetical protein
MVLYIDPRAESPLHGIIACVPSQCRDADVHYPEPEHGEGEGVMYGQTRRWLGEVEL